MTGAAQPDQIAPEGLALHRCTDPRHAVLQIEQAGHQRRRNEHFAVFIDGALRIGVSFLIRGIVLLPLKEQGLCLLAAVEHHPLLTVVADTADAQRIAHITCDDGTGNVKVSTTPEGHRLLRQGKDVLAHRHEINIVSCLRGRRHRQLEYHQQAQYPCGKFFLHSSVLLFFPHFGHANLFYGFPPQSA